MGWRGGYIYIVRNRRKWRKRGEGQESSRSLKNGKTAGSLMMEYQQKCTSKEGRSWSRNWQRCATGCGQRKWFQNILKKDSSYRYQNVVAHCVSFSRLFIKVFHSFVILFIRPHIGDVWLWDYFRILAYIYVRSSILKFVAFGISSPVACRRDILLFVFRSSCR